MSRPPAIFGVITIDVDPMIQLGPLTLSWHGLTIALGLVLGIAIAARHTRRLGLGTDSLFSMVGWVTVAGIVGARLVFLLEDDPAALLRPADWLGSRGFSFYGGMILGTVAVGVLLYRRGLSARYLDAIGFGFPPGMALGRVGDLINGEHYGTPSGQPWAVRHPHPGADVPSPDVAYHSGGLYEILLALAIGVVAWTLRDRLRHPGTMLWTVVGLYAAGRFVMFFYRSDSASVALGLDSSQWLSLLLVCVAGAGLAHAGRVERTRTSRRRASSG